MPHSWRCKHVAFELLLNSSDVTGVQKARGMDAGLPFLLDSHS